MSHLATDDKTHPAFTTTEENERAVIALQSIITQTDKTGHQIRVSSPTYEVHATPRDISSQSIFRRFICCFQKSTKDHGATYHAGSSNSINNNANETRAVTPNSNKSSSLGYAHRFYNSSSTRPMPLSMPSMGETSQNNSGKKCLALDLDETLVHSSFQPVERANYIIPVNIEGTVHNVFVIKRPGVDEFMQRVSQHYEVVIYTASLSKYADPLLDVLDGHKVIYKRLFRENCVFHDGHYVKDLSLLNRDIKQTIIVDNSPMSYKFHPENAIDCSSFIDDPADIEMWQIADFLIDIKDCEDVRDRCKNWREWCRVHSTSADEQIL